MTIITNHYAKQPGYPKVAGLLVRQVGRDRNGAVSWCVQITRHCICRGLVRASRPELFMASVRRERGATSCWTKVRNLPREV